jgi:hypothetical protein
MRKHLYDTTWDRRLDAGPIALIYGPDGEIGVLHDCKTVDHFQLVVAPRLSPGHTVSADGRTVTPSILCPDCGLHGFLTDGVWHPA